MNIIRKFLLRKSQAAENKIICDFIDFLESADWESVKPYASALSTGGITEYGGFKFRRELYCYTIWKSFHTSYGDDKEYYKVMPLFTVSDKKMMACILDAQTWIYP